MRRWEIEAALQRVPQFSRPDVGLEQYATGADVAAEMLSAAAETGDIEGQLVADLGCGTGMLSRAAVLHGASFVVALDVDTDNATTLLDDVLVDVVRADILAPYDAIRTDAVDVAVLNPPFGTKRRGADAAFLAAAARIAGSAVYSMHKTSTAAYLGRTLAEWGADAQVVARVRFDIPRSMHFHSQSNVDVDVDVWRAGVSTVDTVRVVAPPVGPPVDYGTLNRSKVRGARHRRGAHQQHSRSRPRGR